MIYTDFSGNHTFKIAKTFSRTIRGVKTEMVLLVDLGTGKEFGELAKPMADLMLTPVWHTDDQFISDAKSVIERGIKLLPEPVKNDLKVFAESFNKAIKESKKEAKTS